jgi:hypothetical protein
VISRSSRSASKHLRWNFEAQRLSGLEVDHQLEIERKLRRLGPVENPRRTGAEMTISVGEGHSVTHQSTSKRELTKMENRRQVALRRQRDNAIAPRTDEWISSHQQSPRALLGERR